MAFANVSDLESRWRELSSDESTVADALLGDAATMLTKLVDVDSTDTEQAALLKIVSCNMVKRAMSALDSDAFGMTTQSMTAVGFSQSNTFANPSGDMYLTKYERKLLGISNSYISSIAPYIGWGAGCDEL